MLLFNYYCAPEIKWKHKKKKFTKISDHVHVVRHRKQLESQGIFRTVIERYKLNYLTNTS